VVGTQEGKESRLEQGVRGIGEGGAVACTAAHPRQKVEVEDARFEAEPVVVPATEEAKAAAVIGVTGGRVVEDHGEVAEIPIDQHGDALPLVVVERFELQQELMCVAVEYADVFWQKIEIPRCERTLEQVEQVDQITLDRIRSRGQFARHRCARGVELRHLAPEVFHLAHRENLR